VYQGLDDVKSDAQETEKLKGAKEKEKGGKKKNHNIHGGVLRDKLDELVQTLFDFFNHEAHGKGFRKFVRNRIQQGWCVHQTVKCCIISSSFVYRRRHREGHTFSFENRDDGPPQRQARMQFPLEPYIPSDNSDDSRHEGV